MSEITGIDALLQQMITQYPLVFLLLYFLNEKLNRILKALDTIAKKT